MYGQSGSGFPRFWTIRSLQVTFISGLLIGILLGWAFSGIVGAIMKFGLLTVLLIPLAIALFFWWKIRTASRNGTATVMTWSSSAFAPGDDHPFGAQPDPEDEKPHDVIDLDELRRERRS